MAGKYASIGYCFSFLVIICLIYMLVFRGSEWFSELDYQPRGNTLTLYPVDDEFFGPGSTVKCNVSAMPGFRIPSLQSFIQATTTGKDQDFILNGLAVYSKLSNACQPLEDVRNAQIQVHKVALVSLTNNKYSLCPLEKLTVNAQNAGYSVLICFTENSDVFPSTKEEIPAYKHLIPILYLTSKDCYLVSKYTAIYPFEVKIFLASNDRTNVEIRAPPRVQYSFELEKMRSYLSRLYYWFLVGPIVTLVWLTRTKKFCWMSVTRQAGEGRAVGNGTHSEMRNMEDAANSNEESFSNSVTEQRVENHHGTDDSERQPLLIAANIDNAEYMRQTQVILNKHKFVTRYVFYISVCMIFAYLESNVVAVFYFALNSQGSLNNLKLTALRTVAIGLTLSTSFSSSMHIIRKLVKPRESLFESLSEN
ncbi:uncharacterized protein [Montipora capricornis]|uniref:uncharacterized protein isoform X2 n=1 Tax=Montipora capricornis TaxID=246305 RepID=UPI0035F10EC1